MTAGVGSDGGGDFLPSHTGPGSIVIRGDTVVPTAAEAGASALADIAGAVAPVDLAGTNFPAVAGIKFSAVAGMKFSSVAEVHSSAVEDEGDPSVVCTSRQRSAVILDPMAAPRKDGGPMEEISVLEPLEHSVLEVSLEGSDSLIVEVAMPDPLEHSGVGRAADVVSELLVPEPLEHLVLVVEVGDGLVDTMTVLDPLKHSGAMDLLDMSVTTAKGNRYVLVMVDCFSRWTEACPLPDKTALAVADAVFQHIVCRFGMPMVIHSDQGREFENKVMHELCLLCGSHKTRTTPYHPESDGLVERFNRTLLMMLAMFAGENRDDWDDLLPAVMMAYRSSVHESMGFSPYRLMFGEECTLPMDVLYL